MQLFHLDADKIQIKDNLIEVFSSPKLISQLRKVLRVQKWDIIFVQSSINKQTIRYKIKIDNRTDEKLLGTVENFQIFSFSEKNITMLIAMPNKRDKAELIVQKLSEIWINNIYFRVSERSIIRKRNKQKADRIEKIALEAVEQSRWIQLPEIKILNNSDEINKAISWNNIILANKWWIPYKEINKNTQWNNFCGIIGPEWGFSEKDMKMFREAKIIDLWENILRMETASIILARLLKN